jgi:DNA-binding NtrC family response regulator
MTEPAEITAPIPVRRVLFVDSIDCDPRGVVWVLREAGFEVTYATSCRDARGLDRTFDALLLEAVQDDGSGVALAGEFLATGKVSGVVFYTEGAAPEVLSDAGRLGTVLFKNNGPMQLPDALRRLEKPKSHFPRARTDARQDWPAEQISSSGRR